MRGLLPGSPALLSPHFLPLISSLLPEVPVRQQQLLGMRKACWAVSRMPLSLLVLGKADKEQLRVPPQAPACCWRGAPSPHQPGASAGCWHVEAGLGSPCPGKVAACSCRQGCCLPRGYCGENPSLKGQPHLSCPFPPAGGLGLRDSKAMFSSLHQHFQFHNVLQTGRVLC